MNQTRTLLLIAVLFLGWMLFTSWQQDYAPKPPTQSNAPAAAHTAAVPAAAPDTADGSVPLASAGNAVPTAEPTPGMTAQADAGTVDAAAGDLISIDTDVLHLAISTRGASIVRADLKAYTETLESSQPVRLLSDEPTHFFVAQSGLVSTNRAAAPSHKAVFATAATQYALGPDQDSLQVVFRWQDASGIEVIKTYTVQRGSYVVKLEQTVVNHGTAPWQGFAYRQLQRVTPPQPEASHFLGFSDPSRYSFFGAGWYDGDAFQKRSFEDLAEEPLKANVTGGWLAMLQHYFFAAWLPAADEADSFGSAVLSTPAGPHYLLRAVSPTFQVAAGARGSEQAELFVGPKRASVLKQVVPSLELAVDYGKLTPISKPLHWILSKFEALTGNWGVAIILLLLLIKGLFFKLSEAQYRSMAKMRKLQPKVQALKTRYGEDKQKMQQAMMELYKKEKANPMAGCLPMLIQIPVFFALYYMLMQSVELRHAPFFGWIQDLSAPDPYFVLPVINGLLMLAMQLLTPTTGMDPTQAKIMKFMPVAFAAFFALFPAGLVLYYCVNSLISLLQMWIIMRRFEAHEKAQAS